MRQKQNKSILKRVVFALVALLLAGVASFVVAQPAAAVEPSCEQRWLDPQDWGLGKSFDGGFVTLSEIEAKYGKGPWHLVVSTGGLRQVGNAVHTGNWIVRPFPVGLCSVKASSSGATLGVAEPQQAATTVPAAVEPAPPAVGWERTSGGNGYCNKYPNRSVSWVQCKLFETGFNPGIDGVYGPITVAALNAWQMCHWKKVEYPSSPGGRVPNQVLDTLRGQTAANYAGCSGAGASQPGDVDPKQRNRTSNNSGPDTIDNVVDGVADAAVAAAVCGAGTVILLGAGAVITGGATGLASIGVGVTCLATWWSALAWL